MSSSVHLGIPVKLEIDQLFTLERHYLPLGKIGGFPAWLNPIAIPKDEQLACRCCGSPMAFLLQIYSTNPADPPHAFHRVLYVFVCRKGECSKVNDASNFAVFRCQLSRQNDFYNPTEALNPAQVGNIPDPFYNESAYTKLCVVCGCRGGKRCAQCAKRIYCSKEHQVIDWKTAHKDECGTDQREYSTFTAIEKVIHRRKHQFTFPEYGIEMESAEEIFDVERAIESEEDTDDENEEKEIDAAMEMQHKEKQKIREYEELAKANGVTTKDFEGLEESRRDGAFRRFSRAIKQDTEQILRYNRRGQPLLATDYSPAPSKAPDCDICGQPRHFEFQLMPYLLTLMDVDSLGKQSLDWATLLIYTCQNSCPIPEEDGYAREWIFKQDFVAQPKEDDDK